MYLADVDVPNWEFLWNALTEAPRTADRIEDLMSENRAFFGYTDTLNQAELR